MRVRVFDPLGKASGVVTDDCYDSRGEAAYTNEAPAENNYRARLQVFRETLQITENERSLFARPTPRQAADEED